MRPKSCLALLGALLVGLVPSLFGFYQWDRRTSLTASTPAEVTSVSVASTGKRNNKGYRTTIRYRYTVGGRTYEAWREKGGRQSPYYKAGQPAQVCYNPTRPQVSDIQQTTYRCPSSRLPKFLR